MRRLKLGFDLDGVLVDFNPCYMRELIRRGWEMPEGFVSKEFDWEEGAGVPKLARREFWDWAASYKGCEFWRNLPPMDGHGRWGLLERVQDKHDLYFITSRPGPSRMTSIEWLNRNLGVEFPQVLLTKDKAKLIDMLKLDSFIDDRDTQVIEIANESMDMKNLKQMGMTRQVFLRDQPWNQHVMDPRIIRVKNVQEYIERMDEHARNYKG